MNHALLVVCIRFLLTMASAMAVDPNAHFGATNKTSRPTFSNSSIVQNRSDSAEITPLTNSSIVQRGSDLPVINQSDPLSSTAGVFSTIKPNVSSATGDEKSPVFLTTPTPSHRTSDSQPEVDQHLHIDAQALKECFKNASNFPKPGERTYATHVLSVRRRGSILMEVRPNDPVLRTPPHNHFNCYLWI